MSGEVACGRSRVPAACNLGAGAHAVRMDEFRAVLHQGFLAAERLPASVRLRFRGLEGLHQRLVSLAAKEQQCCRFLEFNIYRSGDESWWDIRADEAADEGVDSVLEVWLEMPARLLADSGH